MYTYSKKMEQICFPFSETNMLRIFVIVIIANAAMAQVPFLGTCPNLEAMQNFELDKVSIGTTIILTYNYI